MKFDDAVWEPADGGEKCTIRVPLNGFRVQAANIFLRLGSRCVYRTTVGGPAELANIRQKAYEVFDPDLDHFRRSLEPADSSRASEFERAVGRLFHFLGFSINLLSGEGKITEAVDTLAFTANPARCFAIECTTGSIDAGGKLGKLVARVKNLSTTLSDVSVFGIVVTSLRRDQVAAAEIDAAAANRLIVLCQEDLQNLLGAISPSESTIAALPYLMGKLPIGTT